MLRSAEFSLFLLILLFGNETPFPDLICVKQKNLCELESLQLALSLSDKRLCKDAVFVRYRFFQRWEFLRPFGFALLVF